MAPEDDRAADLARLYDLDLEGQREDVELYLALAGRRRQSVLELACGSGRIAIPLAMAGHEVIGVDNDAHMLARARAAWAGVAASGEGSFSAVDADLTRLELDRRFDLVILGLNALLMLPGRGAQLAALRVAAGHLEKNGGRVVIDVWLPAATDLAAYDGSLELAWQRVDPGSGEEVAKLWSADYDAATSSATITTYFDSWPARGGPIRRVSRRDELSLIGASELQMLVGAAGMRVETMAGDYAMSAFGVGSERAVLVCVLL